jgi:hypothetical protein
LPSQFLSKNIKIKIYKSIAFPFVLYDFERCSLTLSEERRPRIVANWLGPVRYEIGE